MQPKNKPRRRTLVAGVSLFAILIAAGFMAWERNRDEPDKPPSTTNNTTTNNTTVSNSARQEEFYPVTIIVIDDFSQPLKALVNEIDERASGDTIEHFRTTAEQIRALADEKPGSDPQVREEIISRVAPLKEEVYGIVAESKLMNLDGRDVKATNCAAIA